MLKDKMKILAAICLAIGGAFGMAGTFAPSDMLRSLAWGIDGVSLVIAGSLLTLIHFRAGHDLTAGGFMVFTIGQGLIVSTAPMSLTAGIPLFGSGVALWAAGLALISAPNTFPVFVRLLGLAAAALFTIVAFRILSGELLSPVASPLPFFAYPILVATMIGWIWTLQVGNPESMSLD